MSQKLEDLNLNLTSDRIVGKKLGAFRTKNSVILLPGEDGLQKEWLGVEVLFVGPEVPSIQRGDVILTGKLAGAGFTFNGEHYVSLRYPAVFGTTDKENITREGNADAPEELKNVILQK